MQDKFNQFFAQHVGKYNQGDTPQNKGECVGLIELWLDFLKINDPHLWGNAKDLFANADPTKFQKIANTPDNHPELGDIPVLDSNFNQGEGHTGVCDGRADINSFDMFVQNDPIGGPCQVKTYKYRNLDNQVQVIGWLRPILSLSGDDILLNNIQSVVNNSGTPQEKIIKIRKILS